MKADNGTFDAGNFLARLQESRSFRESVSAVSCRTELDCLLDGSGYAFDLYHLIQAMAEYMEGESEESRGWNWSLSDEWLLDVL